MSFSVILPAKVGTIKVSEMLTVDRKETVLAVGDSYKTYMANAVKYDNETLHT